jgi:maltooligosyltrehalose trehalohydrolase
MDAQWIDEFHHALRVTAGGEKTGYYSDFNGIEHLAKAYKDAYVYDGQYSTHRNKFFGRKADDNPGKQFIVFSQNHDQVGNRMLGERTSILASFEMQKLLAGAVLVSPYLPMLFMGEEWSEPNPFLYFVSHTDPELAEAVRKGRKEEFAAFHLEGEAPDPMDELTFRQSKLQWNLINKEPHATMLRYYQQLIRLRKERLPLRYPDRKNLEVDCNPLSQTLVLRRHHEDEEVLVLMNFSKSIQSINVPGANTEWSKLLASSDKEWRGAANAPDILQPSVTAEIGPESITLYTNQKVTGQL